VNAFGPFRRLLRLILWLAWASLLSRLLATTGAGVYLRLFLLVSLLALSWLTYKSATGSQASRSLWEDDE
jgi:uncharacterized membrane protein